MLATRAVMEELRAAAAAAPAGFEVGGLLVLEDRPSRGDVVVAFEPWTNLADRPGAFTAPQMGAWETTPGRVFVHSHTHTNGMLSDGDVDYAAGQGGLLMAVYAAGSGLLHCWEVSPDRSVRTVAVEVEGERRARRVAARPGRR